MFKRFIKFLSSAVFSIYLTSTVLHAEIINQIEIDYKNCDANQIKILKKIIKN